MSDIDALRHRILSAWPDPIDLTDDELAKLSAYNKVCRPTVSFSALQRKAQGDLTERARLDQEKLQEWKAIRVTLEYNQQIREAPHAPPSGPAAGTADSSIDPSTPPGTTAGTTREAKGTPADDSTAWISFAQAKEMTEL